MGTSPHLSEVTVGEVDDPELSRENNHKAVLLADHHKGSPMSVQVTRKLREIWEGLQSHA